MGVRTFFLLLLLGVVAVAAEGPSEGDWRVYAGRVVDAQTGEPIAGISLVVSWTDEKELRKRDAENKSAGAAESSKRTRTYRTGPHGQFEFKVPPNAFTDLIDGSLWGMPIEEKYQFFGRTVTSWHKVAPGTYRMDGVEVRLGKTDVTRIYSGQVVDRVTGKPLAGIEVGGACNGNYSSDCQNTPPVFTDGLGRFVLTTGKNDYLDRIDGYLLHRDLLQIADGAGRRILCNKDPEEKGRIEETRWSQVSDGVFRMGGIQAHVTAMPRITGVVVDAQQQPVPWVSLRAEAVGFLKDDPPFGDLTSAETITDTEGRFSMTLSPAEYQIRLETCRQYTEQDCVDPIAPVYYPGDVTNPDGAGRIRLNSGSPTENIRVRLRPITTYAVKGAVRFPSTDQDMEVTVGLSYEPKSKWPDRGMYTGDVTAKDGVFELRNVTPGKYRLTASYFRWASLPDGNRRGVDYQKMVQTIEVTDHDLEGADFAVRTPLHVKVRMRTADGSPAPGAHPSVSMRGPEGSEREVNINFDSDGTGESHAVMRGDYLVNLTTGDGTNYYCTRFLMNGVERTTPYLDLTDSDDVVDLEFVLSKAQARLSGMVAGVAKGVPVSSDVVCKITVEAPNPPWEMSWQAIFTATNGGFRYGGNDVSGMPLVPGDYRIACMEVGMKLPPLLSGPSADGRKLELPTKFLYGILASMGINETSGHPNRLRVPEDYSRDIKLIAGPLN